MYICNQKKKIMSLVLGFTGDNCEINYDDCQLSPCENNATCVDGVDSYTCNCLPGYTDDTCSTDINECNPSPCGVSGTCIDLVNGYEVR